MEKGNRSNRRKSNSRSNEFERALVLGIMRDVEAGLNVGIIPAPSLEATTKQTPRTEDENDEHLVSSVTVNIRNLQNLSENVDIRELDDRWRGEIVHRVRIRTCTDESEYEESEDYLTTFTLADNIIVIRFIQDFRPNYYPIVTQIIWNSKFTWQ